MQKITYPIVNIFIFTLITNDCYQSIFAFNDNTRAESEGLRIPKCCPKGSSYVIVSHDSEDPCPNYTSNSREWTGFLYDKDSLVRLSPMESKQLRPEQKILQCSNYLNLLAGGPMSSKDLRIKLLTDGTVVRYCRDCPCKKWLPLSVEFTEYCIDGFGKVTSRFGSKNEMYYSGNEDDQIVLVCPQSNSQNYTFTNLYIWIQLISAILYFMLALIFLLLWETQNLPGWIFIALVLSRLFMFLFLAAANILNLYGMKDSFFVCKTTGILAHFFMLSSFTWLTVINFDYWWTFRSLTPRNHKSTNIHLFLAYVAFAVGLPTVVVSVGITMDSLFWDTDTEISIPDYGHGNCFVDKCATGPFIYYIIVGLLVASLILSALTFRSIYILRKESASARNSSSAKETKDYMMYAKLSLVCGITWSFEFLSWAFVPDGSKQHLIWTIIDIFNILITAILIFILFGCRQSNISDLERKYHTFNVVSTLFRNCILTIRKKWNTGGSKQNTTIDTSDNSKSFGTFPNSDSSGM